MMDLDDKVKEDEWREDQAQLCFSRSLGVSADTPKCMIMRSHSHGEHSPSPFLLRVSSDSISRFKSCGEFGVCNSGQSCLAGCNPLGSYSSEYCAPLPVCQSAKYTFTDPSRISNATAWNGNSSAWDWTLDHKDNNDTSIFQDGNLAMILTEKGGGTRISSTRTLLYGNITASLKTVAQTGVITAFITMSGVKDEIDWELVGNNTAEAQTNYYWEGDVAGYTQGGKAKVSARDQNFIQYGIVWQPDQLLWTINGAVVRTLTKASTLDKNVPGLYHYPQTPSRIQLSVWPAGIASSPQGTIDWGGGLIDWTSSAYTSQGYFASIIEYIQVDCYDDSSLQFVTFNDTIAGGGNVTKRALVERDNNVQSYFYGKNNTAGQIAVYSSDSPTIIDSATSTGIKMLTKKPTTTTAAGKWWNGLALAARVGIIIGGVAVFLICLICVCTCWARRNDKKKYATLEGTNGSRPNLANSGSRDNIPLVEKKFAKEQYSPSYSSSQVSMNKSYHQPEQEYGRNQYDGSGAPRPQWPQQQQQYSPSLSPQPQNQGYYGGAGYSNPFAGGNQGYQPPQQQQQYGQGYQQGRY